MAELQVHRRSTSDVRDPLNRLRAQVLEESGAPDELVHASTRPLNDGLGRPSLADPRGSTASTSVTPLDGGPPAVPPVRSVLKRSGSEAGARLRSGSHEPVMDGRRANGAHTIPSQGSRGSAAWPAAPQVSEPGDMSTGTGTAAPKVTGRLLSWSLLTRGRAVAGAGAAQEGALAGSSFVPAASSPPRAASLVALSQPSRLAVVPLEEDSEGERQALRGADAAAQQRRTGAKPQRQSHPGESSTSGVATRWASARLSNRTAPSAPSVPSGTATAAADPPPTKLPEAYSSGDRWFESASGRGPFSLSALAAHVAYSWPWISVVFVAQLYTLAVLPVWSCWAVRGLYHRWVLLGAIENFAMAAVFFVDALLHTLARGVESVDGRVSVRNRIVLLAMDYVVPAVFVLNGIVPYFNRGLFLAHHNASHQVALTVYYGRDQTSFPRIFTLFEMLLKLSFLKWPRIIVTALVAWSRRSPRRRHAALAASDQSRPSVLAREVNQLSLILVLAFAILTVGISDQADIEATYVNELFLFISDVQTIVTLMMCTTPDAFGQVVKALGSDEPKIYPNAQPGGGSVILSTECPGRAFEMPVPSVSTLPQRVLLFWHDYTHGCVASLDVSHWADNLANQIYVERTVWLGLTLGLAAVVFFTHHVVLVRPLEALLSRIVATARYLEQDGTLLDVNHDLPEFREAFASPDDMFAVGARKPEARRLTIEQAVERVANLTAHIIRASWQPGGAGLRAILRDVRRRKYDPIFKEVVAAFVSNKGGLAQGSFFMSPRSRRTSGITRFAMEAAAAPSRGVSMCSQDSAKMTRSRILEGGSHANSTARGLPGIDLADLTQEMPGMGIAVGQHLQEVLARLGEWDWNVLQLDYSALAPVCVVMFRIARLSHLCEPGTLEAFVDAVLDTYNSVPYHNAWHAVDCLHSMMVLLSTSPAFCRQLSVLDRFALMVAALTHDVGHLGVNNAFLVANRDHLALMYNDTAVQESMHCALVFQIALQRDGCNIFAKLKDAEFASVRASILSCILATDMARHFPLITQLRLLATRDPPSSGTSSTMGDTATDPPALGSTAPNSKRQPPSPPGAGVLGRSPMSPEDRVLLMNASLYAVDVAKCGKKEELARLWGGRLIEEFWAQGDRERAQGRTPNRVFDRTASSAAESLLGYCEVIALPILGAVHDLIGSPATTMMAKGTLQAFVMWTKEQHAALRATLHAVLHERTEEDGPDAQRTPLPVWGTEGASSRGAPVPAPHPRASADLPQSTAADDGGIAPAQSLPVSGVAPLARRAAAAAAAGTHRDLAGMPPLPVASRAARPPRPPGPTRDARALETARSLARLLEQFHRVMRQFAHRLGVRGPRMELPEEAERLLRAAGAAPAEAEKQPSMPRKL